MLLAPLVVAAATLEITVVVKMEEGTVAAAAALETGAATLAF
jgi:hypothetical protein